MKRILPFLLVSAALFPLARGECQQQPVVAPLTLAKALEMAFTANPDLRIEAFNTAISETDVARARSIFDATFTGSLTQTGYHTRDFGRTSISTGSLGISQYFSSGTFLTLSSLTTLNSFSATGFSTSEWQSTLSLSITQPLLKNAGKDIVNAGVAQAKTGLTQARERYRQVALDISAAVIVAYNRAYAARQSLDSRKQSLEAAQRLLEEIRANPAASRIDALNAEHGVVIRRKDLVDAERMVRDQEAVVRYLIGVSTNDRFIAIDPPSPEEPKDTQEEAERKALTQRPDLRQLKFELQMSKLQERVARNQLLPDLSVSGSAGVLEGRDILDRWWSGALQFSMPLENVAAESDYRRAKVRSDQLRAQILSLTRRIRDEIGADMRALISARLQLQVSEKAQQLAEQRLEDYRQSNRAGTSPAKDVLEAENDLALARSNRIEALEGFADAVAKLYHDTGELLEKKGLKVPAPRDGGQLEELLGE